MSDQALREHLVQLLRSSDAHVDFDKAVRSFAADLRGAQAKGLPHTAWQLMEHLRIAQWDIVEFCRNPDHTSPSWPDEYWPDSTTPPDRKAWDHCVEDFRRDLQAMCDLVLDTETDLFAEIPGSENGETILREALLLADHNSYHLAQLVTLRQAFGAWPPEEISYGW